MGIKSEFESRKVGTIELIFMGIYLSLKNWKYTLLAFCTISFPSLIVLSIFELLPSDDEAPALFTLLVYMILLVYILLRIMFFLALSIATNNYVCEINMSYKSLYKKILSSCIPMFLLGWRFWVNFLFRLLLLCIPGIIYGVNNGYYGEAFILRNQKGKLAFNYSLSRVKGNWWRVFFFYNVVGSIHFVIFIIQISFITSSNTAFSSNIFWYSILSETLTEFITIGIIISNTLLFLNLDFYRNPYKRSIVQVNLSNIEKINIDRTAIKRREVNTTIPPLQCFQFKVIEFDQVETNYKLLNLNLARENTKIVEIDFINITPKQIEKLLKRNNIEYPIIVWARCAEPLKLGEIVTGYLNGQNRGFIPELIVEQRNEK
ncbi:hypothetical protein [Limnoraphis robusta]|uniref:Uncharacterized protein n=1 Tax=Limnoraphis robusta CCNP1315 TaxID=3110306 RepID=A0ABU5U1L8_9CYAN|nr:hypothetical protein [Limnoraphis robusta]MEA5495796.1 hypothetical protein [Limnoraphis robusta BA-68 BA1]MEA5521092.1 hypothetical protein [Limnoraphis robusta CCNP1315]MEA5543463.1 hypothetical protein [Limnoraphis robusta CCNP1324]